MKCKIFRSDPNLSMNIFEEQIAVQNERSERRSSTENLWKRSQLFDYSSYKVADDAAGPSIMFTTSSFTSTGKGEKMKLVQDRERRIFRFCTVSFSSKNRESRTHAHVKEQKLRNIQQLWYRHF